MQPTLPKMLSTWPRATSCAIATDQKSAAKSRPSHPLEFHEIMPKTKVLVIEDDRSLAEVLSYNLKAAGYEVMVATDGQEGLLRAQTKSPDVVILDLMLPVVDGLDVCRRLRTDGSTKDLLIVMLTAKAEESDELIGFSLGADDYVTKP